ncbi:MAG: hypothetical protein MHM6MM_000795 [Cercozoa sp. M6MM]
MLKSSGLFGEMAARQQQAAVAKAADELVMRRYLLDRRQKEEVQEDKDAPTILEPVGRRDRHQLLLDNNIDDSSDSEDSDDSAFGDDSLLADIRAKRLAELREEAEKQARNRAKGVGSLETIEQDEFLKAVTDADRCVVHFFHREFARCRIMDERLREIAPRQLKTRFVRMDADSSPFFVAKLAIRTLPTLVCFVDGLAVDRVVGFGELGGTDDFSATTLENRLLKAGVVPDRNGKWRKPKVARTSSLA